MYDLPFYADKTLLSFVWFSEILSLSNYFLSPYSFKKEINHFPTKHRGLGNSYKVTIIFATLVQLKVEYRNQFCRNCKRAKAFRLWIGEKREFIFMQRIALLKRLLLFWTHIVTLKFKVVWFENTYNFLSIFKSRFVAQYVSSLKKLACVAYS